jgi:excinuclease ABC subunit A
MASNIIKIIGAKEHNLKSVTLELPKEKLIVITGPSGSGKSSLALDTLYAEGQRRYVESLSSYARQFLGMAKRPEVDRIEGLCPAIAIDQKTVGYNPRSTIGTITEIYDYFRVLFARVGQPHCPSCDRLISAQSPERIAKTLLQKFDLKTVMIGAPIAIQRKGEFKHELGRLFESGFYRFIINGTMHRLTALADIEKLKLAKANKHTISVLIDNITVSSGEISRMQEAIEKAFAMNNGLCSVIDADGAEHYFSSKRICLECATSFPELEPRFFSFNSPIGACPQCHGLGFTYNPWELQSSEDGEMPSFYMRLQDREKPCGSCHGKRLNSEALAVKIENKNIHDFCSMPIGRLLSFCNNLVFVDEQKEIAQPLIREITTRLTFLVNVGLSYLNLGRSARTLSGGEGQRIRLATQIGSSLSGVLYILDEPSIGLHQRDNDRLIATLKTLRDLGNTVVVVEHDMDTIAAADYLVDMGPAAGILGGEVTACGTPQQVAKNKNSLTGAYLSGKRAIHVPIERRKPTGFLTLRGARANNLRNITVDFPLGIFAAVSGVSGSGKSSLVMQTLAGALVQYFHTGYAVGQFFDELDGVEQIRNVVLVDQSPIGRTPRSNPATYLGIFNDIRELFASLPESNARGYKVGRFSFNVADGRCFECSGDGSKTVSMHFLEDVQVVCKACNGLRYNAQTLEITFKGKHIADILAMSVLEAQEFFANFSRIKKRLDLLVEVGLDYITLGQSSTTFSGGEAQRIKLVNELAKRDRSTLYILDEPTTGLHSADIEKLLMVINKLVDRGNSVLVIEHNLDVLKSVDYLIDIGPDGGEQGGTVVVAGVPEKVADCKESITGFYLKRTLLQN